MGGIGERGLWIIGVQGVVGLAGLVGVVGVEVVGASVGGINPLIGV